MSFVFVKQKDHSTKTVELQKDRYNLSEARVSHARTTKCNFNLNKYEPKTVCRRQTFNLDHKSENSHHGGTSIVEFDGTLLQFGLFVKRVLSEIEGSVTEVTDKLVSGSFISFMAPNSKVATNATIWASPASGMASGPEMAAHPLGKESKECPA